MFLTDILTSGILTSFCHDFWNDYEVSCVLVTALRQSIDPWKTVFTTFEMNTFQTSSSCSQQFGEAVTIPHSNHR